MKKNQIIEFFGLPGVGKTTLMNYMILTKRLENYSIISLNIRKNYLKLIFFILFRHPKLPLYFFSFLAKSKSLFKWKTRFFALFIRLFYEYSKVQKNAIIDQGFLQLFFSTLLDHKLDKEKERILIKIFISIQKCFNIHFVYLKREMFSIAHHLSSRDDNGSRADGLTKEEVKKLIFENAFNAERIAQLIQEYSYQSNFSEVILTDYSSIDLDLMILAERFDIYGKRND